MVTHGSRSASLVAWNSPEGQVHKKNVTRSFSINGKTLLLIGGGILGVLVLLAALFITLHTKDGTLVVTAIEPDAEVQVLNERGRIEITRKAEKGPMTMAVVPGKHQLRVQKDGVVLITKDFDIESGQKRSITTERLAITPANVDGTLLESERPKKNEPEANDPHALMKMMDGFRTKLPPPQGIGEENGAGTLDENGESHPESHLNGIALRMGVTSKTDCMILLTYLKDPRVKIRHIAAFALENVVKAYPSGFPADSLDRLESEQHRNMVQAFIVGIEKLAK